MQAANKVDLYSVNSDTGSHLGNYAGPKERRHAIASITIITEVLRYFQEIYMFIILVVSEQKGLQS
jgi:hypothetical protein